MRLRVFEFTCTFCFSLVFTLAGTASAQTSPAINDYAAKQSAAAQKIRSDLVKIGRGNDVTIVRLDGHEFYGSITRIENDFVSVNEVDLKTNVEIDYDQIQRVTKGYGQTRAWTGKRITPKKHIIGLIIGIAAVAIPVIILVSVKD